MIVPAGAASAANSGIAAAMLNVTPEVNAAWSGLAACASDSPSSSRTWVPLDSRFKCDTELRGKGLDWRSEAEALSRR